MTNAQTGLDKALQLAEEGNHAEVVSLLSGWPKERKTPTRAA